MKLSVKIISLFMCLLIISPLCLSCGNGEYTRLSFKSTLSYDYLKTLDGENVSINGYIATSSPVDGSFIFLMNMPYQSCPFCVPNTTELSNTIEVYPKKNQKFDYTASAVKVSGKLVVSPSVDQFFTDPYGYQFNFKIIDAEYETLKSEEMGADFAVWEKFAQSGVIDEIYKMYDYVDFVCKWNEYYVNTTPTHKGYYLNAEDTKMYLESGSKKYGTDPDYFSGLIAKVEAIDKEAFSQLVENIKQAETLAKKAYSKLYNGEYDKGELHYIEEFDRMDYKYTINGGEELKAELNNIYTGFEEWLGSWEL
ncbi:MAG: hypothetical protein E7596_01435 [Ruminococcaceae bacterium]|nr:hypothetical protein [Oscillospiraceae bacterium]